MQTLEENFEDECELMSYFTTFGDVDHGTVLLNVSGTEMAKTRGVRSSSTI